MVKGLDSKRYNGIMVVNKPVGMVSKDVSRVITRKLGKLKLGHVGTLDPLASGVLPILFGAATKVQDYLLHSNKVYDLDVSLGYQTTTLDLDGEVELRQSVPVNIFDCLGEVIPRFVGEIDQIPPIYSAVKYKGRPLYDYVRNGRQDEVPLLELSRRIEIYDLQVKNLDKQNNVISLRVSCSKGTYVRVLARDLAKALGTCGTMTKLVRVRTAGFDISQARSLQLSEVEWEDFQSLLMPIEKADFQMPFWKIPSENYERLLQNGRVLSLGLKEFDEFVVKNTSFYRPDIEESDMFLLDGSGIAFGIASVRSGVEGRVNLKMKRGLR